MNLTDSQIDFILSDIKRRGVTSSSLQEDLLDHICCWLEENDQQGDFQATYQKALHTFGSLKGIQNKTSETIIYSGKLAIFLRCLEYWFTFIYLALGVFFLLLPFIVLAHSNFLMFVLLFPLTPFGCFICFTRINYKKFQLISFPTKDSPGNLVFH